MKPLMSFDSERSAATRTEAPRPLCEVWFTSDEPQRESLSSESSRRTRIKSTYFTLQFISGGKVDGYLAADKNPSEHSYQVASGHTGTHRVIYRGADNKSLLALLFSIQSQLDLKAAKRLRQLKLFISHFSPDFAACCLCSQSCWYGFYTAEQSPPGTRALVAKCDFKTDISH